MMKITLICLGKLKDACLRGACGEYVKRLRPMCSVDIVEIHPSKLPDNPSAAAISAALSAESALIFKSIPARSRVYALCVEGSEFSSGEFADSIKNGAVKGAGSLTFIIGSSFGLADIVKDKADVRMSVSKMTFPHQLARVMLLEQLYRAFQINGGGKYHK